MFSEDLIYRLAQSAMIDMDEAEKVLQVLSTNDPLMADVMAACARPGAADNDSDLEYIAGSGDPHVKDIWLLGGSGLPASHYLPEPSKPTT